jgi:hypothetical protein
MNNLKPLYGLMAIPHKSLNYKIFKMTYIIFKKVTLTICQFHTDPFVIGTHFINKKYFRIIQKRFVNNARSVQIS